MQLTEPVLGFLVALLGRLPVPLRRRPVVLRRSVPDVIEPTEIKLRTRVTLLSSFPVPFDCSLAVPLHSLPSVLIQETEPVLRFLVSLLGRLPVPFCRRPIILCHSFPDEIENAEIILRIPVTLLSSSAVPLGCFLIVLLHALPSISIQPTKPELGFLVPLFGGLPVPPHSISVILPNLTPSAVRLTETILSRWITCHHSQNLVIEDLVWRMKIPNQRHGKGQSSHPGQSPSEPHFPQRRHPVGAKCGPDACACDVVQERDTWPERKVVRVNPLRAKHAQQLPAVLDSSSLLHAQAGIDRLCDPA